MRVALSVTKVFEVEDMTLTELRRRVEAGDEGGIDWYDVEAEEEWWSYSIVS